MFRADGQSLLEVDIIPGLSLDEDNPGAFRWNPFPSMAADRLRLLLVRSLQESNFTGYEYQDVQFPATIGNSDASASDTNCAMGLMADRFGSFALNEPLDGGFYLNRSLGVEDPGPPAPPALWPGATYLFLAGNTVGLGGGGGGGYGYYNGTLPAGGWMLFGGGVGGFSHPSVLAQGSEWYYSINGTGPLEFYELQPAPLHCGYGFADLENTTLRNPMPPQAQVGGDRTISGPYGEFFTFHATCMYTNPPNPSDAATFELEGVTYPLHSGTSNFLAASINNTAATLQVDQWIGMPLWLLVGLGHQERPLFLSPTNPTSPVLC